MSAGRELTPEQAVEGLADLFDGRSEASDAFVRALNRMGAISQDAAPHWRDVAAQLRKAAELAEFLAGESGR